MLIILLQGQWDFLHEEEAFTSTLFHAQLIKYFY